jgi:DDE superfamily endonuclease
VKAAQAQVSVAEFAVQDVAPLQAKLKAAEAAVAEAELAVKDCTVRAPFDGASWVWTFPSGAFARPTIDVLTLIDIGDWHVEANFRESESRRIRAGDRAEVQIMTAPGRTFTGDPRPRRRWSARGTRPKVPYLRDHIRANVIRAVCPATGECCTTIFDGVDTDLFQFYLDHLAQEIPAVDSKRWLLIVDNASLHKTKRLNWHHFELHFLPGYSPDFCQALTSFMNDPEKVASQCALSGNDLREMLYAL